MPVIKVDLLSPEFRKEWVEIPLSSKEEDGCLSVCLQEIPSYKSTQILSEIECKRLELEAITKETKGLSTEILDCFKNDKSTKIAAINSSIRDRVIALQDELVSLCIFGHKDFHIPCATTDEKVLAANSLKVNGDPTVAEVIFSSKDWTDTSGKKHTCATDLMTLYYKSIDSVEEYRGFYGRLMLACILFQSGETRTADEWRSMGKSEVQDKPENPTPRSV